MKKISTFIFSTALAVIVSIGSAVAQPGTYYPNYFINQTFDGIEALPTGWTGVSNNTNLIGHAAATYSLGSPAQGFLKVTASGSGTRGGELRFPSTATSQFKDSMTWVLEFDWVVNSGNWNAKQANGIILMGPNSQNVNANDTWYGDAIFGLYCYKDTGFLHLWNMDPQGPPVDESTFQGPVIYNQANNNSYFKRVGASTSDWYTTDSLNLSTQTKVRLILGKAYHIMAEMNFATQKVQRFVVYQIDSVANRDSLVDMPFIAPWMVGTATTVELKDRVVTALDRMVSYHTRSGGSGALNHSYDNMQLYTWKESVGIADVEVKYVDQDGNVAKASRTLSKQQVQSTLWIAADDKLNFTSEDGNTLYFYDEAATHAANLANPKGGADGESLEVDFSTSTTNYLTIVFKKVAKTAGTYVWSGSANNNWSYVEDNFSVAGGSPMGYQAGNAVELSNANPTNDSIAVVGEISLGDADMTISAPGYQIAGTGRIVGNGSLYINAPVTLAADIRLKGGATVTADSIYIKNAAAADSFTLKAPVTKLVMEAGATFTKDIVGEGGTLNMDLVSLNEYASAISGFSTINLHQKTQTSLNGATWRTGWGGTLPDGCQVNFFNDVEGNPVPNGLGATGTVLQRVKLNLGPHTRLVRQYNENSNSNDVLYVGELTGDATSRLETGFVDGRYFTYNIGGLNTDAVFNGEIAAFTKSYTAATDTTEAVTTYASNGMAVTKAGTGTWTVNNNFNFPASTRGSQVNVAEGKFVINGDINFPNTTKAGSQINVTGGIMEIHGKVTFDNDTAAHAIKVANGTLDLRDAIVAPAVNQLTLTVDTNGVLKTNNVAIGAYNVIISGVVEGGGSYANSFSLTDSAHSVLKLKVTNFAEGEFDAVNTLGDISIMAGTIDITVTNMPKENKEITILASQGNYNILDNISKIKVLVNGEDITANTVDTEMPEDSYGIYYFDPEQGILGYLKGPVGLDKNVINKEIKSIEYYNVLGQRVYHNNEGYSIQKITYTDGSIKTVKVFNKTK